MACCKAGHDHCPMKGSVSECCKISGPQLQSQATAVVKPYSATAPQLIASVSVSAFESVAFSRSRVFVGAPNAALSPPAYITFSALLI